MFIAPRVFAPSLFAAVAAVVLASTACETGSATDPVSPGSGLEVDHIHAALPSLPSPTSYAPGTQTPDQVKVCKDSSSTAGTYSFNISASNTQQGDQVAQSAAMTPGHCMIVFNRTDHTWTYANFALVTITEVIPQGASYRVKNIPVSDFDGVRTIAGPTATVTLKVNGYHGAVANFVDELTSGGGVPIVHLGAASLNGIMAGTTVTCISGGIVNADISISPGSALVGFGPCLLTGTKHLADGPAAQAQIDLTAAYNALAGLPCLPANAIVADLGGTTKPAGVYCTASGIGVTGTLTLDGGGDSNATFVFQAGTSLTTAGNIVLINGALAKNVFWQVGTSATLGTASQFQGTIVALTSITMVDNATLIGRALARNGAVTLGTNNVITLPLP